MLSINLPVSNINHTKTTSSYLSFQTPIATSQTQTEPISKQTAMRFSLTSLIALFLETTAQLLEAHAPSPPKCSSPSSLKQPHMQRIGYAKLEEKKWMEYGKIVKIRRIGRSSRSISIWEFVFRIVRRRRGIGRLLKCLFERLNVEEKGGRFLEGSSRLWHGSFVTNNATVVAMRLL